MLKGVLTAIEEKFAAITLEAGLQHFVMTELIVIAQTIEAPAHIMVGLQNGIDK
jgi:hypothetical protein